MPELCAALGLPRRPSLAQPPPSSTTARSCRSKMRREVRAVTPDFARLQDHPSNGDRHRAGRRAGHRQPGLRALRGHRRGPGDRLGARRAGALSGPKRLGRESFTALQASERTGILHCRLDGDRVILGGHCVTVIVGNVPALTERQSLPRRIGVGAVLLLASTARSARPSSRFPATLAADFGTFSPWLFPIVGLAALLITIPFSRSVAAFPESGGPATYGARVRPLRRLRARLDLLHRPGDGLRGQRQRAHLLSRALVDGRRGRRRCASR